MSCDIYSIIKPLKLRITVYGRKLESSSDDDDDDDDETLLKCLKKPPSLG